MTAGRKHDPPDGFWAPQHRQTLMVSVPYEPTPYMKRFLRWSVSATNRAMHLWNLWPYHTANEAKTAKAAGRQPTKEAFNAHALMVYGETKDRAGQFAARVAAGIARRAGRAITKYRLDREGNAHAKRPKQKKPHVYISNQAVEYDLDGLVIRARVGTRTHPHVEQIPLTHYAAELLRGRRLGEPLIGDGEVMIPYHVDVERVKPSCLMAFVVRLGSVWYAKYDFGSGELTVGNRRNNAANARMTYYHNRKRLKRRDNRVRGIHERKHGAKDANRRKAFLDELAAWFVREGAVVVAEDIKAGGFARRSDKRFTPKGRDRVKGGLPTYKTKQTMIARLNKAGLPVLVVEPAGLGSTCPVCGGPFRENKDLPNVGKWPKRRPATGRMMYCDRCDRMVDRGRAAAMNMLVASMRHSGCREWLASEGVDPPRLPSDGSDLWSVMTSVSDGRGPVDAASIRIGGAPQP